MNCHNCKTPMTGRKRKFCTKTCGTKYAIANNPRRCELDGCGKRHVAKGLCKTHYNETLPNRHRKVEKTCDLCGATCMKDARAHRYVGTFCSTRCRDDAIRKVWPSSPLPDDHWARWYGKSSTWKPSTASQRPAFFANVCKDCGESFIEHAYGVPSAYCSRACTKRVSRRRRRAREHNAPGSFTSSQLIGQFIKQDHACAYCHEQIEGLPDPEHVTPLSRGGRNDMSNIVASCRSCNADKNDLTLAEWVVDRERRGLDAVDVSLHGAAYLHLFHTAADQPAWRNRTPTPLAA